MKLKPILTGFAAFVAAGSLVYAYQGELQAANAAYFDSDLEKCIAWDASGCQEATASACLEDIPNVGLNIPMYQNAGGQPEGEETECGSQLFRVGR